MHSGCSISSSMKDDPARVLIVNHAGRMAGAEAGLLNIVDYMPSDRFSFEAATPKGPIAAALAERNVRTMLLPMRRIRRTLNPVTLARYAISMATVIPGLVRRIRRSNISLVHANSNIAQLYAGPAARRAGVPCVWHCRDLVDLGFVGRILAKNSCHTIAISEAVKSHLIEAGQSSDRMTVIHNCVDPDRFSGNSAGDAVRSELGVPAQAFLIASAGQLVPWKRHEMLIHAVPRIIEAHPHAVFMVVGSDIFGENARYRAELQAMAKGRVIFTGYRHDMPAMMAAIDLLVHPAEREPFGRVILEAMAAGKPVVAVDSCGPSEIVKQGSTGILVKRSDPNLIATAVCKLMSEPGKPAFMGEAGRRRAVEKFNPGIFTNQLEAVYRSVL